MTDANCTRPGCTGQIEVDGYCDDCGRRPTLDELTAPSGATAAIPRTSSRTGTVARATIGGGVVDLPPVTPRDPSTVVLRNPVLPEGRRFCSRCTQPVGRASNGQPGCTEGTCACGARFSFTPKLVAGDLVADQYEVVGCLAYGGLGWIYLTSDRNVEGAPRVLKGLLDSGDESAMEVAIAERRFLASVEHPNIVKIINFVSHEGAGYIVMEYVGGPSLQDLLDERRAANGNRPDPLPAAEAIEYVLGILPALGYLHANGLLFCDFKPDNVIQTQHGLKLIDLGAVYRIGDRSGPMYGTPGFQARDVAERGGPSVPSDLYTVARTLAVLCIDFVENQSTYRYTLPGPDSVPLFAECDSLYRLLLKATSSNPDDRFQSAEEMRAQLLGLQRELVAAQKGEPCPGVSTLFTGDRRARPDQPDWRLLPWLRVSSDDPAAGYLATLPGAEPDELVAMLGDAPDQTVEVQLRLASVLLDDERFDEAVKALDEIEREDPWEWRAGWYLGLVALARDDAQQARACFESVYRAVPGELAPKLALGVAAEASGHDEDAVGWYDTVSRTDHGYTTATFGLARCRLRLGDRRGALEAYDRIPESSISHVDAQVARIRLMLQGADGQAPDLDDLACAAAAIDALELGGEPRAQLTSETLEAALELLDAGVAPDQALELVGCSFSELDVRVGLERSYRSLARLATTVDARIHLVDRANEVRPRTLT